MSPITYLTASNDFRSDTFTTPTQTILQAALNPSIGDATYDEDDDTNKLQERIAKLTGKEAGLFLVSGTMSNQVALRTHLIQPPHSILCDYRSHIFQSESNGLAVLSQAMVYPVNPSNGKYLTLEDIKSHLVLDSSIHVSPTKVISLENTLGGVIFPFDELKKISQYAKENGYKLHCDGARLWNASAETGISLEEYGKLFDSISLCLSKTLGAPIGSVLVGEAKFIKKANYFKKMNGGCLRQSGLLASMASVAIDENFPKLKETHTKAKNLADFLISKGIKLVHYPDTNMVMIDLKKSPINSEVFEKYRQEYNIRVKLPRLVIHYQNTDEAMEKVKLLLWKAFDETSKLNLNGSSNTGIY